MFIESSEKAKELYHQSLVCDMALGFEPEIEVPHKWDVLSRYKNAGFTFIGLAIAGEFTNLEKTIRYIASHKARISNEPDKYIIVQKAEDILTAKKENKLAVAFWLQGSNPLANDLHMLDVYYRLGIRYMLLCYNTKNTIGDGCAERTDCGLSNFGTKIIEEMNRVGMLVDCSHAGYKTSMEAMEISKAPVIFSHSNAYSIHQHARNLKDDQIKALAKTGGVIGINGMGMLLGDENASAKKIVEHIDYIANLVGSKHIALGLDLVYFQEILDLFYAQAGSTTYPPGYLTSKTLNGFQPENLIEVVELLLQHGYQESDVKGILGENFIRVATQVWK
jgi:membrane dipeptidase